YEAAGTYNGAKGTYRCNGAADCTVTLDAKGMITGMSAGWVFTPAEGATSDQPDYAYLHYGFWLKQTEDADGVVTYNEVETFAGAALDKSSISNGGAITGSASYSGGATGVYVRHIYSEGGGKIASSTSGHFSADASLKAYFGQLNNEAGVGTIAPDLLNSITGTIGNFRLSGGEASDWSVALKGDIGTAFDIENGTAKGGVGDGLLSGQFYGAVDTLPVAATGEFNAGFNNGAVAGAFGVNKDD
ncbi:MAG: hypothetical protein OXG71_03155, partial [Rhodospirillales bacterium]|nr:hypothetical protein [Rhodospirillales bacterium]